MYKRLRFFAMLVLMTAWFGYLSYLVATTAKPIVLSRPQFLSAPVVVIAQIDDLVKPAVIDSVVRAGSGFDGLKGKAVDVSNLSIVAEDWHGPGLYILPLQPDGKNRFQIAGVPSSPGFPASLDPAAARPRIYPAMERTMLQLHEMIGTSQQGDSKDPK